MELVTKSQCLINHSLHNETSIKTSNAGVLRISRMVNTLSYWRLLSPKKAWKLCIHPPNLVLCISSIKVFSLICKQLSEIIKPAEGSTGTQLRAGVDLKYRKFR